MNKICMDDLSDVKTNFITKEQEDASACVCYNNKILKEMLEKLSGKCYKNDEEKQDLVGQIENIKLIIIEACSQIPVSQESLLDEIRNCDVAGAIAYQIHNHPEFLSLKEKIQNKNIILFKNERKTTEELKKQNREEDAEFVGSIGSIIPFLVKEMSSLFKKYKEQITTDYQWMMKEGDLSFDSMVKDNGIANKIKNAISDIPNNPLDNAIRMYYAILSSMNYSPRSLKTNDNKKRKGEQEMGKTYRDEGEYEDEFEEDEERERIREKKLEKQIRETLKEDPKDDLDEDLEDEDDEDLEDDDGDLEDEDEYTKGESKALESQPVVAALDEETTDTTETETPVAKCKGSRIATKFQEKTGATPIQYILKNVQPGSVSRWDLAKILTDATNGEVKVSASSAWHLVKDAAESGFYFRRKPVGSEEKSIVSNERSS